jgi:putative oligomerization/nucleic acid binding protein
LAYDRSVFGWLRRKDEHAIPKPGTPEFEAAVSGSALPDDQSVSMGQSGWTSTGSAEVERSSQTIDLRNTGAREDVERVLREHGIDPDKEGQTINASSKPGLREALLRALFTGGVDIPNAGGFGGGISPPKQDPIAVVEELARRRDAGEISDAEFEAQKKRLLGE